MISILSQKDFVVSWSVLLDRKYLDNWVVVKRGLGDLDFVAFRE